MNKEQFKIGDKVRIKRTNCVYGYFGKIGTITYTDSTQSDVRVTDNHVVNYDNDELVEDIKDSTYMPNSIDWNKDVYNQDGVLIRKRVEDPNHPYGGMEVLDNVPKETWEDKFEVLWGYGSKQEIKDLLQQELERIKTNFMTEFTDPDTGLLNISKYDHEEIINFFNNEIK